MNLFIDLVFPSFMLMRVNKYISTHPEWERVSMAIHPASLRSTCQHEKEEQQSLILEFSDFYLNVSKAKKPNESLPRTSGNNLIAPSYKQKNLLLSSVT